MANLKELKNRIGSVKSTRKITKAMQMVAAAKLRKAQMRAESAEPYSRNMQRVLSSVAGNVKGEQGHPLLAGSGKQDVHLLVLVSSDRGLCGGLNTNLVRYAKRQITQLVSEGKQVKLFCVGKKAYDQLRFVHNDIIVDKIEGLTRRDVTYADADDIAKQVIAMFEDEEFDVCSLIYNKFLSVISQEVTEQQIIPLELEEESNIATNASSLYEFEPNEDQILENLLPRNISVQVLHAILENIASEHGARMSAMDNATRNAGEMIDDLSLIYNRTRQATITSDLIEIISGAEAI